MKQMADDLEPGDVVGWYKGGVERAVLVRFIDYSAPSYRPAAFALIRTPRTREDFTVPIDELRLLG